MALHGEVLNETITLTDGLTKAVEKVDFEETITLADATLNIGFVWSETLTMTDSHIDGINHILSDTLTLSEGDTYSTEKVEFTETLTLADTPIFSLARELTDTLTLSDGDTFIAALVLEETLTLADTYTRDWVVPREFTETITLSDGDANIELVQVTPEGSYLVISSLEATWDKALMEVATLLEEQGAPKSQTSYIATYDEAKELFAVAAIVKRH